MRAVVYIKNFNLIKPCAACLVRALLLPGTFVDIDALKHKLDNFVRLLTNVCPKYSNGAQLVFCFKHTKHLLNLLRCSP